MHTKVPDFETEARIEATLKCVEAFNVDSRWEWLSSSKPSWQQSGARWFKAWLRGLNSLCRAWPKGHLSTEQDRRLRELLCSHGPTITALHSRAFKVHAAVLEAVRLCA